MALAGIARYGFKNVPVDASATATRALPASWYTSQDMYELERRAIFSRKWLFMTHESRMKNPGDFLRYEIAGYGVILTRDREGNINAFHNVCRHRAYPVIEKSEGNAKILACRYHGWSYGLNGKLAKAPGYHDLGGFDKTQNGLLPIHVHIDVNGFVWINLDGKETPEVPWTEDFDGVDKQERYKLYNFEDYEFDHAYELDGKYNWKILSDNFNECYHCPTTHSDIPSFIDLEHFDSNLKDGHIQHDSASSEEHKANGVQTASTYYFPNTAMVVSPHWMMVQKFFPNGPNSSSMHYEIFRNKNSSDEDFQLIAQMYKRVMEEDKVLCNNAQKNLNAGVFVSGEMHPRMEKAPLFFQKTARDVVYEHHKREKEAGKEIWPAKQGLTYNSAISQEDVDFCEGLSCSTNKAQLAW
ncbi:putative Rieske 2Fe-2S family protein [Myriangium duriaei CBS 260.36]|uniref:Choline monooxygenase, chloroplastic n=1 Tax=Myriangium duriaei CBS 260.36 TaxID=1168546 RepID=A0A9P4J7L6_9PEZI|nr:putative Rieske 2Fe-2S family protein [Myriangium duriaei CBS 260.36]